MITCVISQAQVCERCLFFVGFGFFNRTDGIGLSAPQVGINVQLMVFNPVGERGEGEEIVLINPRINKYSKKMVLYNEGCLSFPKIFGDVEVIFFLVMLLFYHFLSSSRSIGTWVVASNLTQYWVMQANIRLQCNLFEPTLSFVWFYAILILLECLDFVYTCRDQNL